MLITTRPIERIFLAAENSSELVVLETENLPRPKPNGEDRLPHYRVGDAFEAAAINGQLRFEHGCSSFRTVSRQAATVPSAFAARTEGMWPNPSPRRFTQEGRVRIEDDVLGALIFEKRADLNTELSSTAVVMPFVIDNISGFTVRFTSLGGRS